MVKRTCLALFLTAWFGIVYGQDHPYRAVFDLTSPDSTLHDTIVRWVNGITQEHPDAELEVVTYGKGIELLMPEKSTVIGGVKEALKNPKVSFVACETAMKRLNVKKSQLVEGSKTVPDGIYEIVKKQQDGWAYIKVVR